MKTPLQKQLLRLGNYAATNQVDKLRQGIAQLGEDRGGDWQRYGARFLEFLDDGTPRFTVYKEGNSKLPFYAFSALPIITCPGFGDCGKWCYSFTAWRYPAAYFRQLQNTFLIINAPEILADEFRALPRDIDFRLYVDGDIDSAKTLGFWMELFRDRPDVRAYGYSKSWPLFLAYAKTNQFPPNYKLNLSGGSRYGEDYLRAMQQLDCVRGEFVGFDVETAFPSQKLLAKSPREYKAQLGQYKREVMSAAIDAGHEKVFVCPGKCGECVRGGIHACGSSKFDGVTVAIGIH
tara:strand:+ start:699 stop:1571 length:873 start_codon:yes stop_codon:yes gene_type:complete